MFSRFEPVDYHGRKLAVEVRQVGSRYSMAEISEDAVIISLSVHLGQEEALKTAYDLYGRVVRSAKRSQKREILLKDAKFDFFDGQRVTAMGTEFQIKISEAERKHAVGILRGTEIEITVPPGIPDKRRVEVIQNLSRRLISGVILEKTSDYVKGLNASHFNSMIKDIRIKGASTRWGSCSPSHGGNNINLNFWLLFMPEPLLRYVAVHELAHTIQRNHSKDFWKEVERVLPDYKALRKELRGYKL